MLTHRFADAPASDGPVELLDPPPDSDADTAPGVSAAIARARDALLSWQHDDGHWCGELEGDSILQSEYLCLLIWLGRECAEAGRAVARRLLEQQESGGHWGQYPGAPIDVSATVKAVLALRAVYADGGGPAELPSRLAAAKRATLAAGGAERVNSFTRYYLALLGQIAYRQCPAVPPELLLVPGFSPLNLSEISAVEPHDRRAAFTAVALPAEPRPAGQGRLSRRPVRRRAGEPAPPYAAVRSGGAGGGESRFDWHRFFYGLDRAYKAADRRD